MDFYNGTNAKKKLSYNTINSKLNALARKGYLDKRVSDFGNLKEVNYISLKTKREDLSYNSLKNEKVLSLGEFLEMGFRTWLSCVPMKTEFFKLRNMVNDEEGEFERVEITREEAEKIILCKNMLPQ